MAAASCTLVLPRTSAVPASLSSSWSSVNGAGLGATACFGGNAPATAAYGEAANVFGSPKGLLPAHRAATLLTPVLRCSAAADGSSSSTTSTAAATTEGQDSWVPVIPFSALPRGERRLIRQDGETVLLLWYKDDIYALENTSPAEGAYTEGFFNARLTADGCIVCPSTETTFDLKTGAIKEWYPTNPILAFLTRPTRQLEIYPVKTDGEFVYINTRREDSGLSAEIVFGGSTQAGRTADDVNVDEVRMVVDENDTGFGFTSYVEMVNGRAAMLGLYGVIVTELVTGKGFLKGLGFLDFLYQFIK